MENTREQNAKKETGELSWSQWLGGLGVLSFMAWRHYPEKYWRVVGGAWDFVTCPITLFFVAVIGLCYGIGAENKRFIIGGILGLAAGFLRIVAMLAGTEKVQFFIWYETWFMSTG